jgi:branched-chain amino acid transport system ATP-binding protein
VAPEVLMSGFLEIEAINKRFRGLRALDDISFAVDEGGVFGVIGANGAGKTTLFNVISGAMKPDSGLIRFAGNLVTGHTPSNLCIAGIARTFQIARPFPDMTVLETIRIAVLCRVRNMRAATARAADIAGRFGLTKKLDRLGRHLSVLERKRLELARAYATEPRLLLLDEVAAGLRPGEVDDLVAIIRSIGDENITVLMIEHVLAAVFALARRVVVLDQGRVIAQGAPQAVAEDARVIEAYLGAGYAAA